MVIKKKDINYVKYNTQELFMYYAMHLFRCVCVFVCACAQGSSGRPDPALREQLESSLDENIQLQEMLGRKNKEFHQTQSE